MRLVGRSLLVFAVAATLVGCQPPAAHPQGGRGSKASPRATRATPAKKRSEGLAIAAARELDQQGVRAFTEGRYRQAYFFFDEARRRGGPATELWNMARCLQKMGDVEGAIAALERYLEEPRLSSHEREEGRRELAELNKRPSRVTALSDPAGAVVTVGEKKSIVGRTPVSFDLPPGDHTVVVELAGRPARSERVVARFGQPVIVEVDLD